MEANNKLIAEFMGIVYPKLDNVIVIDNVVTKENELKYHTSWNWLMPVVDKIKILVMEDDSDELYNSEEWDNITHTLVQIEIKSVYQAVIEFITTQNN